MRFDRVLFVGDVNHREFAEPWEFLRSRSRELRAVSSPEETGDVLAAFTLPPELIVVAQLWPGQFRQSHLEALHREAPLSRLIALLGSWCEGESYSGTPWSGVPRLYWHQFVARLQSLVAGKSGDKAWRLPRTATDAERWDVFCRPRPRFPGRIAIATADWLSYQGLADACGQVDCAATWLRSDCREAVSGLVAGIWDDSSSHAARPCSLAEFVQQVRPAPAVALLSFPRREDRQRALDVGAALLYAKPFSWDDLLADLARLVSQGTVHYGPWPAYASNIPA
jgi:hypothetical protein